MCSIQSIQKIILLCITPFYEEVNWYALLKNRETKKIKAPRQTQLTDHHEEQQKIEVNDDMKRSFGVRIYF